MTTSVTSSGEGHLGNSRAQTLERALDARLTQEMALIYSELMSKGWGRRLVYHLVFERGRLEALSFEPLIKDGICAAMHMARNEGIREYAAVLAEEIQRAFPEQWSLMIHERRAALAEEDDSRRQARTASATTPEDDR